jgi:sulfur carrier protein ThiS
MEVLVKLSASLRREVPGYDPQEGLEIDLPGGATIQDALDRIDLPAEKIKIVMVNGLTAPLDHELVDGDRIALFPALGGG